MKLLIVPVLALSLQPSVTFAKEKKTPVREIKSWIKSTPADSTCLDDYFKRRNQLKTRMILTPVVVTGSMYAGFAVGGLTAVALTNPAYADGWGQLAAFLGGAIIGGAAGIGTSTAAETISFVNFYKNRKILRLVYEARTDGGPTLDEGYKIYKAMNPEGALDEVQFQNAIADLDSKGQLCDGSIVPKKRLKRGKKLKQRLARIEEIFQRLSKI